MQLMDRRLSVGASIGLAMYPDQGRTKADLLRSADVAMYAAKACGGGVASNAAEFDGAQPGYPAAA